MTELAIDVDAPPDSGYDQEAGERVVEVGSGAGFDTCIAAGQVGTTGPVVGVDMTPGMLAKSRESMASWVRRRRHP